MIADIADADGDWYDAGDYDDSAWDSDPCNYCPHDNADHRGDGCLYCGCAVPQ